MRIYRTDELQVLWDTSRCVHVAYCVQALPGVFNPLARPWIRVENGTTEQIIDAIERCPTGALRYVREHGPQEAPPPETSVTPVEDGPLVLRGDLHVLAADGETVLHETRLALCRCGSTENAPFCDNSHRRVGFHSPAMRSAAARDDAESPADIAPPQTSSFAEAEAADEG
ncbi:MAG: (4Fe-4S)-binding protein [Dehalococcoidia bacterium]